jgi:solute carrier family 15 (oligopeptide transporter), member 1
MANDAAAPSEATAAKQGHPLAFWFFFWGEFAERSAYYGSRVILILYLTTVLGFSQASAQTTQYMYIAACYFMPLIGGYIADNFLGKYWTIVGFAIPYVIGMFMLGSGSEILVFLSLALLAIGSGVIKPNITTLMGLTYDQQRPGQDRLRSDAFAYFYLAINIGAFLSQLFVPIIRNNYGFAIAFAFPAVLMAIALAVFAAGRSLYGKETVGIAKTQTAEERSQDRGVLLKVVLLFLPVMFFWAIFDQNSATWVLFAHTYQQLEIFGYSFAADQIQSVNALLIIVLLPLITILWKVLDKRGIRVRPTDKMILGFLLTSATMWIMAVAGFQAGELEKVPRPIVNLDVLKEDQHQGKSARMIEDRLVVTRKGEATPLIDEKVVIQDKKVVSDKTGADLTEWFRVKKDDQGAVTSVNSETWVKKDRLVSDWYQILAFVAITVAEILISVTGLELAYVIAPKSMQGQITACWLAAVGLGNLVINGPVSQLYVRMNPGTYFAMLAIAAIVVAVIFHYIASDFNKPRTATA